MPILTITITVTVMTAVFYSISNHIKDKTERFISSLACAMIGGLPIGLILAAPVMQY